MIKYAIKGSVVDVLDMKKLEDEIDENERMKKLIEVSSYW